MAGIGKSMNSFSRSQELQGILPLSYERDMLNKDEIVYCVERLRDANRFIGERYLQLLLERIQ